MLVFSEQKCLNKNNIMNGWATINSRHGSALQVFKIKSLVNC